MAFFVRVHVRILVKMDSNLKTRSEKKLQSRKLIEFERFNELNVQFEIFHFRKTTNYFNYPIVKSISSINIYS